jgi:cytochrome b subunit of formate dehydrogenase
MKTKVSALIADVVLVVLVIGGAIWLFLGGFPPAEWTSDRPLLPLIADSSRLLIALAAFSVILGIVLAWLRLNGRDHLVDGEVVRYTGYQRLAHWALAIGFILDFGTAAWLLRWVNLETTIDNRPALYVIHFIGAGLIVLGGITIATSSRIRGQSALFPRWRDVSPAIARLFGYLGTYGEPGFLGMKLKMDWLANGLAAIGIKPAKREGKFLAVEKVLSFTPLAILAAIVIVTGLIKAARYFFVVPGDVLYWTTWLHDLSTWLTLIVVGVHIIAIFLVPRNRPGIGAMLRGRISLRHVEEEFPAWADELRQREPRPTPTEGVPAHGTVGD